jgi:putative drug exporter of the RND superfamily
VVLSLLGLFLLRLPFIYGAALGAAVAVLLVLAVPFLSLRLAFTDAGTNPSSYTSRQAYDLLAKGFGPGTPGTVAGAPGTVAGAPGTVAALRAGLASQPDVAYVSPAQYNPGRTAAVLTVIPRTSPQDARTSALVRQLRDTVVPRGVSTTARPRRSTRGSR